MGRSILCTFEISSDGAEPNDLRAYTSGSVLPGPLSTSAPDGPAAHGSPGLPETLGGSLSELVSPALYVQLSCSVCVCVKGRSFKLFLPYTAYSDYNIGFSVADPEGSNGVN